MSKTRCIDLAAELDMICFGNGRGFAKTADHRLFLVSDRTWRDPSKNRRAPYELVFSDTQSITRMMCISWRLILLVSGGSVYELRFAADADTNELFEQIQFPDGGLITKIVNTKYQVFYLTVGNRCYTSQ